MIKHTLLKRNNAYDFDKFVLQIFQDPILLFNTSHYQNGQSVFMKMFPPKSQLDHSV